MLEVLYRNRQPETEVVGVEQPFDVPLIDLDTGEVLDRALVGTLDLVERDAEGGLTVVISRRQPGSTRTQVEASLQLSVQLRDGDERPRGPGGPAAPVRCAHEDEAAGAVPVLDAGGSGGERAALSPGGRGMEVWPIGENAQRVRVAELSFRRRGGH